MSWSKHLCQLLSSQTLLVSIVLNSGVAFSLPTSDWRAAVNDVDRNRSSRVPARYMKHGTEVNHLGRRDSGLDDPSYYEVTYNANDSIEIQSCCSKVICRGTSYTICLSNHKDASSMKECAEAKEYQSVEVKMHLTTATLNAEGLCCQEHPDKCENGEVKDLVAKKPMTSPPTSTPTVFNHLWMEATSKTGKAKSFDSCCKESGRVVCINDHRILCSMKGSDAKYIESYTRCLGDVESGTIPAPKFYESDSDDALQATCCEMDSTYCRDASNPFYVSAFQQAFSKSSTWMNITNFIDSDITSIKSCINGKKGSVACLARSYIISTFSSEFQAQQAQDCLMGLNPNMKVAQPKGLEITPHDVCEARTDNSLNTKLELDPAAVYDDWYEFQSDAPKKLERIEKCCAKHGRKFCSSQGSVICDAPKEPVDRRDDLMTCVKAQDTNLTFLLHTRQDVNSTPEASCCLKDKKLCEGSLHPTPPEFEAKGSDELTNGKSLEGSEQTSISDSLELPKLLMNYTKFIADNLEKIAQCCETNNGSVKCKNPEYVSCAFSNSDVHQAAFDCIHKFDEHVQEERKKYPKAEDLKCETDKATENTPNLPANEDLNISPKYLSRFTVFPAQDSKKFAACCKDNGGRLICDMPEYISCAFRSSDEIHAATNCMHDLGEHLQEKRIEDPKPEDLECKTIEATENISDFPLHKDLGTPPKYRVDITAFSAQNSEKIAACCKHKDCLLMCKNPRYLSFLFWFSDEMDATLNCVHEVDELAQEVKYEDPSTKDLGCKYTPEPPHPKPKLPMYNGRPPKYLSKFLVSPQDANNKPDSSQFSEDDSKKLAGCCEKYVGTVVCVEPGFFSCLFWDDYRIHETNQCLRSLGARVRETRLENPKAQDLDCEKTKALGINPSLPLDKDSGRPPKYLSKFTSIGDYRNVAHCCKSCNGVAICKSWDFVSCAFWTSDDADCAAYCAKSLYNDHLKEERLEDPKAEDLVCSFDDPIIPPKDDDDMLPVNGTTQTAPHAAIGSPELPRYLAKYTGFQVQDSDKITKCCEENGGVPVCQTSESIRCGMSEKRVIDSVRICIDEFDDNVRSAVSMDNLTSADFECKREERTKIAHSAPVDPTLKKSKWYGITKFRVKRMTEIEQCCTTHGRIACSDPEYIICEASTAIGASSHERSLLYDCVKKQDSSAQLMAVSDGERTPEMECCAKDKKYCTNSPQVQPQKNPDQPKVVSTAPGLLYKNITETGLSTDNYIDSLENISGAARSVSAGALESGLGQGEIVEDIRLQSAANLKNSTVIGGANGHGTVNTPLLHWPQLGSVTKTPVTSNDVSTGGGHINSHGADSSQVLASEASPDAVVSPNASKPSDFFGKSLVPGDKLSKEQPVQNDLPEHLMMKLTNNYTNDLLFDFSAVHHSEFIECLKCSLCREGKDKASGQSPICSAYSVNKDTSSDEAALTPGVSQELAALKDAKVQPSQAQSASVRPTDATTKMIISISYEKCTKSSSSMDMPESGSEGSAKIPACLVMHAKDVDISRILESYKVTDEKQDEGSSSAKFPMSCSAKTFEVFLSIGNGPGIFQGAPADNTGDTVSKVSTPRQSALESLLPSEKTLLAASSGVPPNPEKVMSNMETSRIPSHRASEIVPLQTPSQTPGFSASENPTSPRVSSDKTTVVNVSGASKCVPVWMTKSVQVLRRLLRMLTV